MPWAAWAGAADDAATTADAATRTASRRRRNGARASSRTTTGEQPTRGASAVHVIKVSAHRWIGCTVMPAPSSTGQWERAVAAGVIGIGLGLMLVLDRTVSFTEGAVPALALLPATFASFWGGLSPAPPRAGDAARRLRHPRERRANARAGPDGAAGGMTNRPWRCRSAPRGGASAEASAPIIIRVSAVRVPPPAPRKALQMRSFLAFYVRGTTQILSGETGWRQRLLDETVRRLPRRARRGRIARAGPGRRARRP